MKDNRLERAVGEVLLSVDVRTRGPGETSRVKERVNGSSRELRRGAEGVCWSRLSFLRDRYAHQLVTDTDSCFGLCPTLDVLRARATTPSCWPVGMVGESAGLEKRRGTREFDSTHCSKVFERKTKVASFNTLRREAY